jgi:hypothetical protein
MDDGYCTPPEPYEGRSYEDLPKWSTKRWGAHVEQAKSKIRAVLDALPLLPEQCPIQLLSASEHIPHEAYKELSEWAQKELRERGYIGRVFDLRIRQNTLDRTQVPRAVAKRKRLPKETVSPRAVAKRR